MKTITCYDLEGKPHAVPADQLLFSPAVYGIFIENEQVLLARHPQTGRWQPPGGRLRPDETPTQSVRHYFREITGMTPKLGSLLIVEEQYALDADGQAYHLSNLYYNLDRPDATVATLTEIENANLGEWVNLAELKRSDLQLGYDAITAGRLRAAI